MNIQNISLTNIYYFDIIFLLNGCETFNKFNNYVKIRRGKCVRTIQVPCGFLFWRIYARRFMQEVWKDVKGYEGLYQISNLGRVKSFVKSNAHSNTPRIMKLHLNKKGYVKCHLFDKLVSVHRLVAEAFISNPDNKPQVNHKDGDKLNNCFDNLEWATNSENQVHANANGLNENRKKAQMQKVCKRVSQFDLEMNCIGSYESTASAARITGVNQSAISSCCRGLYGYKTAGGYIWKYEKEV